MALITEQELKSALDEELWQNRRACVATPQTPSVQVTWLLCCVTCFVPLNAGVSIQRRVEVVLSMPVATAP